MKRLIYTLAVFTTLFSSCTKEENMVENLSGNCDFTVSANLPSQMNGSRAQITIPADQQLRFILEIRSKDEGTPVVYREERISDNGTAPTFSFSLETNDYDLYMWADVIVKDAITESKTVDGVTYNHYADNFYYTEDLEKVSVKDYIKMFDSDACDAFYGEMKISRNDTDVNTSMSLTRPFAKLVLKEKNTEEYKTLEKMNVNFKAMNSFNVITGEPYEDVVDVAYEKEITEYTDDNTLFTSYMFTKSSGSVTLSTMNLKFTTSEAGAKECTIAEGIEYKRNQLFRATGELVSGGTVVPEPEPDELSVGDYFFSDGTWSSELIESNKENCVGIVYQVGPLEGDEVTNYGGDYTEIKGYVMALKNMPVDGATLFPSDGNSRYHLNHRPYFYKQKEGGGGKDDSVPVLTKTDGYWNEFNGYTFTNNLLKEKNYVEASAKTDYPVLYAFEEWKLTAETYPNASEWYIPASGQLYMASMKCYADTYTLKDDDKNTYRAFEVEKDEALLNSLNKAIEMGIATNFCGKDDVKGYYMWTSTLDRDGMTMIIQIGANQITKLYHKPNYREMGLVRPFLTILE